VSFILVAFLSVGFPVLIFYSGGEKDRLKEKTVKALNKLVHIVYRRDLPRDDE
jgi:hypothetical protein